VGDATETDESRENTWFRARYTPRWLHWLLHYHGTKEQYKNTAQASERLQATQLRSCGSD